MPCHVYVKPFDSNGAYQTDWIEVTKHVEKLGNISIDSDSAEYQIGVYRQSNVGITLNNRNGYFSDVGIAESIFKYKRSDSQVKVTWTDSTDLDAPECGVCICGEFSLSEEIEVFKGLLSDENYQEDGSSETIQMTILGFETLFSRETVDPVALSISIGNTTKQVIYKILNQSKITTLLTVDLANLNPSTDQTVDVVDWMLNSEVKTVLNAMLLGANSILYILNDTVYVTPRTATVAIKKNFYGQASQTHPENVMDISNLNNGFQRMFNLMTWSDSVAAYQDNASYLKYGIRAKELNLSAFTDSAKQLAIVTALVNEFKDPKQELELKCVIDYTVLALNLLDRVMIDYPAVALPSENFPIPIFGIAKFGVDVFPKMNWSLIIPKTEYKILMKKFDFNKLTATLKLRAI